MAVLQWCLVAMVVSITSLCVSGVRGQMSTESGQIMSGDEPGLMAAKLETDTEHQDLRSTLNAVLRKLDEQSALYKKQNAVIEKQSAINKKQNDVIEKQGAMIKKQTASSKKQSAMLETQSDTIEKLNIAVKRLEAENVAVKQVIERLGSDTKHDEDEFQVAFSVASHHEFGPVETNTNIPYEVVYTNIGGDWSTTTSAFHVSVPGLYEFSASCTTAASSEAVVRCHIVHFSGEDQTTVASMYGNNVYRSSAANSVILELQQGDVVSVQLEAGDGFIHSHSTQMYSTLSGFLLFLK